MKKRLLSIGALMTLTAILTAGCGGNSSSGEDTADSNSKATTYTAHYSAENIEDITDNGFFPNDQVVAMVARQNQFFIDYTLEVSGEEYKLTATAYTGDPESGEAYEVGGDSGIAITIITEATGPVVDSTDTTVQIDKAASVTYSIPKEKCDPITEQQMAPMFTLASVDAETPCGTWTNDDTPELLESVSSKTFNVTEGGEITGWE